MHVYVCELILLQVYTDAVLIAIIVGTADISIGATICSIVLKLRMLLLFTYLSVLLLVVSMLLLLLTIRFVVPVHNSGFSSSISISHLML